MIDKRAHNINCINRDLLDTLVFSENLQVFTSFYSIQPNWNIKLKDRLFNISHDNILYECNIKEQQSPSFVQFVVNKNAAITKVFDNAEFSAEFQHDYHNFSKVWFQTNTMISKDVDYIDKREDTYKHVIPRVDTGLDGYFPNRMKGKWVVCNYEYDHPNSYFRLPYIITKFRTSFI